MLLVDHGHKMFNGSSCMTDFYGHIFLLILFDGDIRVGPKGRVTFFVHDVRVII